MFATLFVLVTAFWQEMEVNPYAADHKSVSCRGQIWSLVFSLRCAACDLLKHARTRLAGS